MLDSLELLPDIETALKQIASSKSLSHAKARRKLKARYSKRR
jgi:hypothetical protein